MPTRRELLLAAAGAAGLAAVGACGSRSGSPSTPSSPGTRSLTGSSSAGPRSPDWEALRRRTTGTLRLPSDEGYDVTRELFDRRFDDVRPAAVLSARTPADVRAAVSFARAEDLPLAVRAGGHSYVGGSTTTGLVVDLRPMAGIQVGDGTVRVGAGAALIDVYTRLAGHGVGVPAGSCPTVGVAGLALGGGQGVVSRRYGLTCDRVRSMQVVLADGRLVTASADREPDLFWALRGGGGSFGAVTSLELTTHPTTGLATSYHRFDWDHAPAVLTAWSAHLPAAERGVWSTCHLLADVDEQQGPGVTVACVAVGSTAMLARALQPFLAAVGSAPTYSLLRDRTYLDTMRLEAGCYDTSERACHLQGPSPGGTLQRDAFVAGSAYFTRSIAESAAEALAGAVEERQRDATLEAGGAGFDTWGGAIADVAAEDSAFVHRDVRFGVQYTASWAATPGNRPLHRNQVSLARLAAPLAATATGAAYQNYADDSLADPLTAYYGANLDRLRTVKAHYDPDDLFAPPQGIRPAG